MYIYKYMVAVVNATTWVVTKELRSDQYYVRRIVRVYMYMKEHI